MHSPSTIHEVPQWNRTCESCPKKQQTKPLSLWSPCLAACLLRVCKYVLTSTDRRSGTDPRLGLKIVMFSFHLWELQWISAACSALARRYKGRKTPAMERSPNGVMRNLSNAKHIKPRTKYLAGVFIFDFYQMPLYLEYSTFIGCKT